MQPRIPDIVISGVNVDCKFDIHINQPQPQTIIMLCNLQIFLFCIFLFLFREFFFASFELSRDIDSVTFLRWEGCVSSFKPFFLYSTFCQAAWQVWNKVILLSAFNTLPVVSNVWAFPCLECRVLNINEIVSPRKNKVGWIGHIVPLHASLSASWLQACLSSLAKEETFD